MKNKGYYGSAAKAPRDNTKGFLYALGGTLLVSTNYITAKYGLRALNPETFSVVWTCAASLYALLVITFSGRLRQLVIPARSIRSIVILGLATGIGMLLAWSGLSMLDPSFASFLWRFSPVLIIVLSVLFLGERLRFIEIIPIAVPSGCVRERVCQLRFRRLRHQWPPRIR